MSFVGLFAAIVEERLAQPVDVRSRVLNETIHVEEPIETERLLSDLREWNEMREAVSQADIVLIVIGFDDTPWNRFDDPCGVAPNFPIVNWNGLTTECMEDVAEDHRKALDAVLTEIEELRAGRPTVVRVVTTYNSTIGDTVDPSWDSPDAIEPSVFGNDLFVEIQCEVAANHGAECADIYHVFNGSDGREPAGDYLATDYTHLSQRGHDAVASVLADLGLEPLSPQ
jgi:lysophospholipase L1-like esterase